MFHWNFIITFIYIYAEIPNTNKLLVFNNKDLSIKEEKFGKEEIPQGKKEASLNI